MCVANLELRELSFELVKLKSKLSSEFRTEALNTRSPFCTTNGDVTIPYVSVNCNGICREAVNKYAIFFAKS